ncbi:hypothetical protein F2Q68_00004692 [Brassica cretica]|uniref:Uncharacterized protein n=1 Tax=Brassica cretica TaxID=69181 RepID=A0A8S9JKS5_BRACR|nr:hypothetical protein F2Q68_00004692 [Brassica cretica]
MSDTHNRGEEISADTYATVMRHQFNLESLGDRLQKIEDATTIMKDKWRRGDEAMRDFTEHHLPLPISTSLHRPTIIPVWYMLGSKSVTTKSTSEKASEKNFLFIKENEVGKERKKLSKASRSLRRNKQTRSSNTDSARPFTELDQSRKDKCQVSEDKCHVSEDKYQARREMEYFREGINSTGGRRGKGKPP